VEIGRFNVDPHRPGSRLDYILGVGGRQEVISQPVPKVSIGEIELPNFEIQFCDLWDQFQFEAIIGCDLLEKLGAVIDYPRREITFTRQA
jgi:hypothetical protein